ncbi:DUF1826 domain-containing protein [Pyxidicoccus fallax]|uniref:DUF1826 domain-containing protein n=2 Tax=Pyxidicoccus fallax TaxID=394095 RepID=A0A848LJ84_9BACT|nr:DUF1826 domain-containing protein [Pyxidicoccus fallax]NMO17805.1 DUF1826 domain-containing protein [Pyxidicoccus fallax]NPC79845.1 DUF1826 domain-containing protein [Pyxidicoccus fallax]
MAASVFKVSDVTEARRAIGLPGVRGILHPMPMTDPLLIHALACHQVTRRTALGPFELEHGNRAFAHASTAIRDHLARFGFSSARVRSAFAAEVLRTLEFFVELLQDRNVEYRIRFIPREAQESRPHYDYTALSLVRTFLGPGTWVHQSSKRRFQVAPSDLLILKGTAFPAGSRKEALLHDYPAGNEPSASASGRVVVIARTMTWNGGGSHDAV